MCLFLSIAVHGGKDLILASRELAVMCSWVNEIVSGFYFSWLDLPVFYTLTHRYFSDKNKGKTKIDKRMRFQSLPTTSNQIIYPNWIRSPSLKNFSWLIYCITNPNTLFWHLESFPIWSLLTIFTLLSTSASQGSCEYFWKIPSPFVLC